jgi:hypothetical protein
MQFEGRELLEQAGEQRGEEEEDDDDDDVFAEIERRVHVVEHVSKLLTRHLSGDVERSMRLTGPHALYGRARLIARTQALCTQMQALCDDQMRFFDAIQNEDRDKDHDFVPWDDSDDDGPELTQELWPDSSSPTQDAPRMTMFTPACKRRRSKSRSGQLAHSPSESIMSGELAI